MSTNKEEIREHIQKQYAKAAKRETKSCCSGSCGCNGTVINIGEVSKQLGYSEKDLLNVPLDSNMGLGCGNPIAIASLKEGEVVLDLGSGGGFDCFLARKQVGTSGRVIGVDMTSEMVMLARKNVEKSGYTNVEFRLGEIEHLPVADNTVDVIISNCVINLSLNKEQVFKEAFRVLKRGGRFSISDVVAIAQIPKEIQQNLEMISGCIGGAAQVDDIKGMLQNAGFKDIKMSPKTNSADIVAQWAPKTKIENYIASYIIEATKN